MIMKQQQKLAREKLKEVQKLANEASQVEFKEQVVAPKVEQNGYIEYKVDFVASLSDKDDAENSWDEACSESEGDDNGVDEFYDDEDV